MNPKETKTASITNQSEYTKYAQEMEQTLSQLETRLHNSDKPEEIIKAMLIAACSFYDGDWAGIMEADLTMKIWSTLFWYNRNTDGMTPNRFSDIEDGEYLCRWIDALTHGNPIIIEDIEKIRDISPIEYTFLKMNRVKTMIAVPFWKRPTGFLIVRNPKRYIARSSLLQMMAFVAVSSVNEKRLMDSTKLTSSPDIIKKDTDILINLFDGLEIITSKGILRESDIKSSMIINLVAYLLLHNRRTTPALEIFHALWPDEDDERAGVKIKSIVYRFQQLFGLISDYRLIESTPTGYRINSELNVITDLDMFTEYWNQAQITSDLVTKGHLLKKAMEVYKTGLLPSHASEHWVMPSVAHYSLRYMGVVNQLLSTLNKANDYVCIHEYANIAITAVPGSVDAHYWLTYAMIHLGSTEIAKNELQSAKKLLTDEDYQDLLRRLNINNPEQLA